MRRLLTISLIAAAAVLPAVAPASASPRAQERPADPALSDAPAPGDPRNAAREAALAFGRTLQSAGAAGLRALLPDKGKVLLRLVHLGPEDGYFSAGQVDALFQDFLKSGSVRSFDLVRVDSEDEGFAIAHCRAALTDRDGRPARVDVQLVVQPEDGRWVVREIRELRR